MTVVYASLNLCEENNYMLPCFGLIKSIFITDSNVPYFVCKQYKTLYFDKHYQAFNLTITSNLVCIALSNLENISPTHHNLITNGLTFTLKL